MLNPEVDCDPFEERLGSTITFGFGGKVSNEYLVCGGGLGGSDKYFFKDCYKVGDTEPFLELLQPRTFGGSVVLPNDTLFILGDYCVMQIFEI